MFFAKVPSFNQSGIHDFSLSCDPSISFIGDTIPCSHLRSSAMQLLHFTFVVLVLTLAGLGSANNDPSKPTPRSPAFEKPLQRSHLEKVEELADFLNQHPNLDVKATIHTLVLYWQREDYTLSEKSIAGHVRKRLNPRPNEVDEEVDAEDLERDGESAIDANVDDEASLEGADQEAIQEPEPVTRQDSMPTLWERSVYQGIPEEEEEEVERYEEENLQEEETQMEEVAEEEEEVEEAAVAELPFEPEQEPIQLPREGKARTSRPSRSRKGTVPTGRAKPPQRVADEEIAFLVEETRKLMLGYDDVLNDPYELGYLAARLRERFRDISKVELKAAVTIQAYIKEQPLLVIYDETPRLLQRRLHNRFSDLDGWDAYELIVKTVENEKRVRWKNPPLGESLK